MQKDYRFNQEGVVHFIALLLISAIGILAFVFLSSTASFKDKLFSTLYPKKSSFAASLWKEIQVCTIPANSMLDKYPDYPNQPLDWVNRGSKDLPSVEYRSEDNSVLPRDSQGNIWLQLTALSLDGKILRATYLKWNTAVSNFINDPATGWLTFAPEGKPPFGLPNPADPKGYRSFDQVVFPNNKIKQTFLSRDGKTIYYRYIDWNGSAWVNQTAWATTTNLAPVDLTGNTGDPNGEYRSFDHVVFPTLADGSIKLRQSMLSSDGKKLYIRYLNWDSAKAQWTSSNNFAWEYMDLGLPDRTLSFSSYDLVVFPDKRIKHTVIQHDYATLWLKYQNWGPCLSQAVQITPNSFNLAQVATQITTGSVNLNAAWIPVPGVYDVRSNKTYVVYPGGIYKYDNTKSAVSPYIILFDHTTKKWSSPTSVYDINQKYTAPCQANGAGCFGPDAHFYPQVLVDKSGYIHVFYGYHNSGINILHAVSNNPGDTSTFTAGEIPNTGNNTYIKTYKANNGDMYVLYRASEIFTNGYYWEPHAMTKSTDNGRTWSKPLMVIDGGKSIWGTPYVGPIIQDEKRNGIHIIWRDSEMHNVNYRSYHYAFLSFQDDNFYSVNGKNLGHTIEGSVLKPDGSYGMTGEFISTVIFQYPDKVNGSNLPSEAIGIDPSGRPHIYLRYYNPTTDNHLASVYWNGTNWVGPQYITQLPAWLGVSAVEYYADNNIFLYASKEGESIYRYYFDGTNWKAKTLYTDIQPTAGGMVSYPLINKYNTEVKGIFNNGEIWVPAGNFSNPTPKGNLFAFTDISYLSPTISPSMTPLPSVTPTPRPRQDLCVSESVSGTVLSSAQTVTITSTSKTPVTKFVYAFYNLDNLYSNNTPKPIQFTSGTDYKVLETLTTATTTHSITVNFADFNKPDTNNLNRYPTRIQVNAYFIDSYGMTSIPTGNCVKSFSIVPKATPLPTPRYNL